MGDVVEFPIEERGTIPRNAEQWVALLQRVQRKLEELGPGRVKLTLRLEHTRVFPCSCGQRFDSEAALRAHVYDHAPPTLHRAFVLRPEGVAEGNVYTTLPLLMAAAAQAEGAKVIDVDELDAGGWGALDARAGASNLCEQPALAEPKPVKRKRRKAVQR